MTKLTTAPPAINTTLFYPAGQALDDPHPNPATGSGQPTGRLVIVPIALRTARAFIAWTHRYLLPPQGAKFVIGVGTEDGTLVGVVTAERPASRTYDDSLTIEVTHLTTDGTPNACSALLSAAWRAARAMGYRRLIAYTRAGEPGTCLRAAGLCRVADRVGPSDWDTSSQPQAPSGACGVAHVLWEITAPAPQNRGGAQ
ncbi:hypothetical protein ITP53_38480 [Nonomuraea sp. K274]|uniref:Uncharacterized protein n=1 Tax=Nonomuraea cypriaca TaxID=1187855 RepID=A0A931AI62_9ACTN|nr:XF1762 family protein [Nonomuraea cypriaca]MBF8191484.1 hypothetical protein [Nonomuraea cypriaca]